MRELPFPSLMEELLNYGGDRTLYTKVRRIHRMAIKSGRIGLADKIEMKYRQCFPKSDLVMAFGMSLLATKQ